MKKNRSNSEKAPLWQVIILFILAIVYTGTIGYSRLFLGVHSLDQVVYGWTLGTWSAFTIDFCLRQWFMNKANGLL